MQLAKRRSPDQNNQRRARHRKVCAVCLLISGLAIIEACVPAAPRDSASSGKTPRTISLRLRGAATDALVYVDDEYIGYFKYVQEHGVALPAGKHRITVEKHGHFPWDTSVNVKEGDPLILFDVKLDRVPD